MNKVDIDNRKRANMPKPISFNKRSISRSSHMLYTKFPMLVCKLNGLVYTNLEPSTLISMLNLFCPYNYLSSLARSVIYVNKIWFISGACSTP